MPDLGAAVQSTIGMAFEIYRPLQRQKVDWGWRPESGDPRLLVAAVRLASDKYGGRRSRFIAMPHEVEQRHQHPVACVNARAQGYQDRQQKCESRDQRVQDPLL